jgi:hypothetical protein
MTTKKNHPSVTILTIVTGFLLIYFITKGSWAIDVALVIGLLSLISETLASYIEKVWMKIGWLLSLIIPNILLTLVFFFILTPIALLAKLISKKDHLSLSNPAGSLFKEKSKGFDKASFENPW